MDEERVNPVKFKTPELMAFKLAGRLLFLEFKEAGHPNPASAAVSELLRLFTWGLEEYARHNDGEQLTRRYLSEKIKVNGRRKLGLVTTKSQMVLRSALASVLASRIPCSLEKLTSLIRSTDDATPQQFIYVLPLYHDLKRTVYAGAKIGITSDPRNRLSKLSMDFSRMGLYAAQAFAYSSPIGFDKHVAEKVEAEVHFAFGLSPTHGREFFEVSLAKALPACVRACVKNGFDGEHSDFSELAVHSGLALVMGGSK